MFPVLFSIGSFHLYSLSVFFIFAWLVFSFLFWRALRTQGVDEERIFDLTFYSTLMAYIGARSMFVLLNLPLFASSPLKIIAVWIAPGLSLYGAVIGGLLTLVYLSRTYKVRLGHVLDAFALSFPSALFVGLIGAFLDGTYVGIPSKLPWAVRYVGHLGTRHPVQVYEMIALLVLIALTAFFVRRGTKQKWTYGVIGLWFFGLYSVLMFSLEFMKDTHVYFQALRANQLVLIALFGETLGAFYVRGGGREQLRPIINKVIGGIYAKFSKRSA